jgi:hypothetical protein
MDTPKRLVLTLSACLGIALLVIAFLAGRMTVAPAATPASAVQPAAVATSASTAPPSESGTGVATDPSSPAATPVTRTTSAFPSPEKPSSPQETGQTSQAGFQPLPQVRSPAGENSGSDSSASKAAIASYFAKVDSIQVAGSGNTSDFAQGILTSVRDGDMSRVDELVDSAKSALTQAQGLQPPPDCMEYNRRLLGVLSDSVAGLEQFRTSLKNGDTKSLLTLAARFQATQQKVDALEQLKKQLLAR